MARSTSFLFTNSTATVSKALSMYNMDEAGKYTHDTKTNKGVRNTTLNNKTLGGMGLECEKLTYQVKSLPSVSFELKQENRAKGMKSVQYSVKISDLLRTTDSDDSEFIQDDAIFAQLTIAHDRSPYITEAHVATVVSRLISALQHEDGDWRFNELAIGDSDPKAN